MCAFSSTVTEKRLQYIKILTIKIIEASKDPKPENERRNSEKYIEKWRTENDKYAHEIVEILMRILNACSTRASFSASCILLSSMCSAFSQCQMNKHKMYTTELLVSLGVILMILFHQNIFPFNSYATCFDYACILNACLYFCQSKKMHFHKIQLFVLLANVNNQYFLIVGLVEPSALLHLNESKKRVKKVRILDSSFYVIIISGLHDFDTPEIHTKIRTKWKYKNNINVDNMLSSWLQ